MEDVLNNLLLVGGNAALAALAFGLTKFTNWIGTKIKDEKLRAIVTQLDDAAMIAVKAEYQRQVKGLKKANQFTPTMQRESQRRAREGVQASLGVRGLKDLSKQVGQDRLAETIQRHIDAAVHDNKRFGRALKSGSEPRPLASE